MAKLLYEKKEGIAWIRFNRPEVLNAINAEEVAKLVEYLRGANNDEEVKVIILSSVGKAFCSGDDLREMCQEYEDIKTKTRGINEIIESLTEDLQEVARQTTQSKKVVIAAVRGYALGAGFEIALDSDLLVLAENATLGFPEPKAGMSITGGVTKLLPMTIGLARAKEMFFTGRYISADEAYEFGMANRVVPEGEEEAEAEKLAREVMKVGPLCVTAHKRMIHQSANADFETVLNLEKQTIGVLCTTEDAIEAANAFMEKRDPVFKGS